ncbi:MFS transporter [Vallicoccus soli]|uniref:MFS transporter n=1 Tax=Vallicoccus soli TaxID=2339232 RepID=A0A3A3Z8S8_9ACTN|nr:MFS transporter [Vallicoccus soli]
MDRWSALALLRRVDPVARLLVLTMLAFNVGFFMVLPFLAVHLGEDLGLAAGTVGLLLGLRTASQQGLFLLGGTLADHLGTRPVVLTGIVVRIAGFVLLGAAQGLGGVVAGVVLVGVAGALFTPAVEAALARTTQERGDGPSRSEVFALNGVCSQVGTLLGPALGTALLLAGFRASCLVAAAVFAGVLAVHLRLLPRDAPAHRGAPVLAGWGEVLRDRPFLLFAAASCGYLATYHQLYLALPLELARSTGSDAAVGPFFVGASLLVVLAQLPLTRWAERRLGTVRSLVLGFIALAAGALLVAAVRQAQPGASGALVAAAGGFVLLLTLGQMLLLPVTRDVVARLAAGRHLGARYGLLSTAGGVAVLASGALVGRAFDAGGAAGPARALPWLLVAALPAAGAVAVALLRRHLRPLPANAAQLHTRRGAWEAAGTTTAAPPRRTPA